MGVIRINPDGEIERPYDRPDDKRDPNLDERHRHEIERIRREVPELQIEKNPEKQPDSLPPWVIRGILEELEKGDKKEERRELPN